MFSSGSPWTPKRVYVDGIDEATRQFLLTLWNTYSFFVTYADTRRVDARPRHGRPRPTHVLDRWIRSRLHRTVRTVTESLEAFDSLSGAQALAELVDDLSNWYVRRSRPRFWKSSDPAAHATLHECLAHDLAAARAVLPVHHRRDVPQPRRHRPTPCTSPTGPATTKPRSTTRSKRRWRSRAQLVSLGRAARERRQDRRAPTAPPRDRAAGRGRAAPRRRRAARSPTSST